MSGDVRERMVVAAARLLSRRGLSGTSFSEVLQESGAPRGSVYHHFAAGKDELVGAAVDLAGDRAVARLEAQAGAPADEVAAAFLGMWREVLTRSDLDAGCAVLAVAVATDSAELRQRTAAVFRRWRGRLAELLAEGGLPAAAADRTAAVLVAAAEGAVAVSRAEHSLEPFDLVAAELLSRLRDQLAEPG